MQQRNMMLLSPGSKKIRESREHDDEIMAASPYKTPRGGSIMKNCGLEERYEEGEEDVPPSSAVKISHCKLLMID
jgi:hypothetical protein